MDDCRPRDGSGKVGGGRFLRVLPAISLCLLLAISAGCQLRSEPSPTEPQTEPSRVSTAAPAPSLEPSPTHAPADQAGSGFVHADGQGLKDGRGNSIKLRGVNLEGWMLQEGWIWGGGLSAESAIVERLEELVGSAKVAEFQSEVYGSYITEQGHRRHCGRGIQRRAYPHQPSPV